jgi:hypothetical protein
LIAGQAPPAGMTREQCGAQIVKDKTYGLIPASGITVTTRVDPSFSDIGKGEPFTDINGNRKWGVDMGVDSVGSGGDIVAYTVDDKWTVMTPLSMPLDQSNGQFDYAATVVVRNAPFWP